MESLTKPKLALIPSAYKASKVYSVLPADGVGDFDFSRASKATRVNEDGLIDTVGSNIPRLNYPMIDGVVSGCPSLLLEPSRTNYVAYSELPSNWTYTEFGSGSNGTITTGKTDMFGGTNAVQIDFPSNAENVSIRFGSTTSSLSSGSATISLYIKLVESGSKNLQLRAGFNGIINVNSTEFTRVDLSGTKTNTELFNLKLRPSEGTSNGGFSIIICHPQEEQGSYPTSYIPTNGSTVTRVAETCNGAGDANTFNDSEGVLYAEISALDDDLTFRLISLSDGTTNNRLSLGYRTTSNAIYCEIRNANVTQAFLITTINDIKTKSKVSVKYKQNDFALWVNGVEVSTDTSGITPINLSKINFDSGQQSGGFFYGNTKQIQYFDTALNDTDLETLTSWTSFNEMARDLLYTIE
jgi:hypothetical protein